MFLTKFVEPPPHGTVDYRRGRTVLVERRVVEVGVLRRNLMLSILGLIARARRAATTPIV